MKSKQLAKGIDQLMDEGVAQLFTNQFNNRKIIGTVGALQFEVIEYRLLHEYSAACRGKISIFTRLAGSRLSTRRNWKISVSTRHSTWPRTNGDVTFSSPNRSTCCKWHRQTQETGVSLYIGVLGFIRFIKFIN